LYGGLLSVGVAYRLLVVGHKNAPPALAAVLLSLETVFAVLGGWWLLDETLTARALWGCVCMFAGMLVSQIDWRLSKN
jgi:drug/metabolite transporter (DMT)-like permease